MTSTETRSWLATLRRYLAFVLLANLVWELAHLPLYTIWDTAPTSELVFAVAHCTLGDLIIATMALVLAVLVAGDAAWPGARFWRVTLIATVFGVGYTVFSEWLNLVVRASWQYAPEMPVVPLVEIGLTPLMQWLILPPMGLWFASRRELRKTE